MARRTRELGCNTCHKVKETVKSCLASGLKENVSLRFCYKPLDAFDYTGGCKNNRQKGVVWIMSELLFKAKRIDNGEWVYGLPSYSSYDGDAISEIEIRDNGFIEVNPKTVCQYTGLTDKNGRKIFKGDIVKGIAYSNEFIGQIIWIEKIAGFGVRYFNREVPTAWENSSILKAIQRWKQPNEFQAEVIGNIFDNPELLED